jgi:hypothetical protein
MVLVNGKNIKLEKEDDFSKFKIKIAQSLELLPKYIYLDESKFKTLKDSDKIKVENIFEISKSDDAKSTISFLEFKKLVDKKFKDLSDSEKLQIFLLDRKDILEQELFILTLQNEIDEYLGLDQFNVEDFLKSGVPKFKSYVQDEFKKFKTNLESAQLLDKQKERVVSPFELEKITFKFITNIKNIDILQIFDHIKLNEYIPYATCRNYYKLFYDFKIPSKYIDITIDIINLRLSNKKTLKNVDYLDPENEKNFEKDFDICKIYYDSKFENHLVFETEIFIKNITEEEVKSRISSIFENFEFEIIDTKKIEIKGLLFMAKSTFNKDVLADLILTNDYYYNLLSVDESVKASKKKPGLYIHFEDNKRPDLGKVIANVIPKTVIKRDLELRNKDKNQFPYGSLVLRIKITSAKNIEAVDHFIKNFSKLISLYDKEKKKVIDFYKDILEDFGDELEEEIEDIDLDLKDYAPDLFLSDYSRKCPKQPKIIPDSEEKSYIKDGYQVMTFPKTKEEGVQYKYVCSHKREKFPGLSPNNNPENRIQYPYLPCCFVVDQSKKKNSPFRAYYFDEDIQKGAQQRLIQTSKFAPVNGYATLPNNLKILLENFDDTKEYLREGMYVGNNSVIESILTALKDPNLPNKDETNKLKEYLKAKRTQLSNFKNLFICRQECYDFTLSDIKKYLQNNERYLDPKLFIRLLEEFFKVNLYIFKKEYEDEDARLILPRHTKGHFYFSKNPERPTILLYEHLGNERDRAIVPQVETIIQWDKIKNETESSFDYDSNLIKGVANLYDIINKEIYILDEVNKKLKLVFKSIRSQYIDQYGKTRAIKVKLGEKIYNIFTSPIEPLNAPTESIIEFNNLITKQDALEILSVLNFPKITQIKDQNGSVNQINFSTGNIKYQLNCENFSPIKDKKIKSLEVTQQSSIKTEEDSVLEQFDTSRKIANMLKENFIYQYSKYLNENGLTNDVTNMNNFVKQKIKIDNVDYSDIDISVSFENKKLYSNGKLIIQSEDTLKRLIFICNKFITRYNKLFNNYHIFMYMQNFYQNISDFQQYPLQNLFYGKTNIINYILTPLLDSRIYTSVQPGKKIPYFYQENNNLYLAEQVENEKAALSKSYIWLTQKFNSNEIVNVDQSYKILFYNSNTNIKIEEIKKSKNDFANLKILVYKKDGNIKWVSLMNL